MNAAYKKVAFKQIPVGKIWHNFDLRQTDKLKFEELLKKVKEQARAKKFDTDAKQGKAGVAVGAQVPQGGWRV